MKRRVLTALSLLLTLAFLLTACAAVPTGAEVENPYPKTTVEAFAGADYHPSLTPDQLVEFIDGSSVVSGTVKEVFPTITEDSDPEMFEILDKVWSSGFSMKPIYHSYLITTEETLIGKAVPEEIRIAAMWCGELPGIKAGDRLIIMVEPVENGYYRFAYPYLPFLYVSGEERIYPCSTLECYIPYTGMTIPMFKNAICHK